MKLIYIDDEEFNESKNLLIRACDDSHIKLNRYATLDKNKNIAIGWASNLLEPFLIDLGRNKLLIGIDQLLIILDVFIPSVLVRVKLDSFFVEAIVIEDKSYIFCQMEIIILCNNSRSIIHTYHFPDLFESYNVVDNEKIIIKFYSDDDYLEVNIE